MAKVRTAYCNLILRIKATILIFICHIWPMGLSLSRRVYQRPSVMRGNCQRGAGASNAMAQHIPGAQSRARRYRDPLGSAVKRPAGGRESAPSREGAVASDAIGLHPTVLQLLTYPLRNRSYPFDAIRHAASFFQHGPACRLPLLLPVQLPVSFSSLSIPLFSFLSIFQYSTRPVPPSLLLTFSTRTSSLPLGILIIF